MNALSPVTPPAGEPSLARVSEQVEELRDLFQRRLLEDKTKNQLVQTVQKSLETRDSIDRGEAYRGVFLEILLAVDRLSTETPSPELNASVSAELLEAMARRGLQLVPPLEQVDARVHEVVGTRAVELDESSGGNEVTEGDIVEERRPGYVLGGRLLRPAQVITAAVEKSDGKEA